MLRILIVECGLLWCYLRNKGSIVGRTTRESICGYEELRVLSRTRINLAQIWQSPSSWKPAVLGLRPDTSRICSAAPSYLAGHAAFLKN